MKSTYCIISRENHYGIYVHSVYRRRWLRWRRIAQYYSYLLAIKAVRDMQARDK